MNEFDTPEFKKLLVNAQAGDKESYRQFLQKIYPWVEGKVEYKVFQRDDMNDVMQEIMLSIHKSLNTYDEAYPVIPWLNAICQRRIIDYIRKTSKKQEFEKSDDDDVTNYVGSENIESIQEQFEILSELPENLVKPIWLTKIVGHSTQEAAQMLNIKENALRTRLSRAFKLIEQKLKEDL